MEGEAVNPAIALLQVGLGRRWTADDASRVIEWMDVEVLTNLGPSALDHFRSHFFDFLSDEEEQIQNIVFDAIYYDLESLRRNNEIPIGVDIDELAEDIFDDEEAIESYFNPGRDESDVVPMEEEEEEYEAFDFTETADDDGVGGTTGLSEDEILKNLSKVIIRVGEEDRICVVCQDGFYQKEQSAVAIQGCGHVYHLDCVSRWLQLRDFCPLCKAKVGEDEEEDVREADKFM